MALDLVQELSNESPTDDHLDSRYSSILLLDALGLSEITVAFTPLSFLSEEIVDDIPDDDSGVGIWIFENIMALKQTKYRTLYCYLDEVWAVR